MQKCMRWIGQKYRLAGPIQKATQQEALTTLTKVVEITQLLREAPMYISLAEVTPECKLLHPLASYSQILLLLLLLLLLFIAYLK